VTDAHVIVVTIDGFAAYLLNDPAASIPTIRKLAAEGVDRRGDAAGQPDRHLAEPHVADHRRPAGQARRDLQRRARPRRPRPAVKVDPAKTQADLVAVPTIYELLKPLGYRTAGINWPATTGSRTSTTTSPTCRTRSR
jgi:hypothetical protein